MAGVGCLDGCGVSEMPESGEVRGNVLAINTGGGECMTLHMHEEFYLLITRQDQHLSIPLTAGCPDNARLFHTTKSANSWYTALFLPARVISLPLLLGLSFVAGNSLCSAAPLPSLYW